MNCMKPYRVRKTEDGSHNKIGGLYVPCGSCKLCKVRIREQWKLRCLMELAYQKQSCFVTLTYSNEFLPANSSLKKEDIQNYHKRLRQYINNDSNFNEENKIKYLLSGEYGDEGDRPHYHEIIFGLGNNLITQEYIEDAWGMGNIHLGYAEADSIRYTLDYTLKKFNNLINETIYYKTGRIPPFKMSSNGLGKKFALEYKDRILKDGYISYQGIKHQIPRYFLKLYGIKNYKSEYSEVLEREENLKYLGYANSNEELYHYCNDDLEFIKTMKEFGKKKWESTFQKNKKIIQKGKIKRRKL